VDVEKPAGRADGVVELDRYRNESRKPGDTEPTTQRWRMQISELPDALHYRDIALPCVCRPQIDKIKR
jgi:hypothetical protein